MPQISVIVPVYKVEKYIYDCIESILSQSYNDFELILVDDGSPDNCGIICDQYAAKDDRIRVVHQQNMGLSGARNSGMDIAQGEYITFIDSDDCVNRYYLEYLLDLLNEYDAKISCVGYERVPSDFIQTNNDEMCVDFVVKKCFSGKDCCLELFDMTSNRKKSIYINAWGKLINKSIIDSLRFPVGRIHEDEFFTPQALYMGEKVAVSTMPLYYYRDVSESIMNQPFSIKRYDDIWAVDKCVEYFKLMNELEIASEAENKKRILTCTYCILAKKNHVTPPKEYRISIILALYYLKKSGENRFYYFLGQYSPRLVKYYEYWIKVKKLLRLKNV